MHGMHHVSLWVPRVVLLLPLLLCGSLGWAAEVSGLPAIVFVSREFNGAPNPNARPSAVELARAGKLLVREADCRLRTLADAAAPGAPSSTPVDVADPDVFYDATRIIFSGYSTAEYA